MSTSITEIRLEDSFGRDTIFTGEHLLGSTTDNGDKPQWLDLDVWRTQSGNYVVKRTTRYRIVHSSEDCSRVADLPVVEADPESTFFCNRCNSHRIHGVTPEDTTNVDVYYGVSELLQGFQTDGRYNNFAKVVLADLAELDSAIDAAWTVRRVD